MNDTGNGTMFASPARSAPDVKTKRNALMQGVVALAVIVKFSLLVFAIPAEETTSPPSLESAFLRRFGA